MAVIEKGSYDVLIIYNYQESKPAMALRAALGAHGIKVWIDEISTTPGLYWRTEVRDGIANSEIVVILVGTSGTGPRQSQEIANLIDEYEPAGKPLVFVLMPDAKMDPKYSIGASGLTHIQVTSHVAERRVLERIQKALGRPPLAGTSGLGLFHPFAPRQRTCFLAVPLALQSDLLQAMTQAAEDCGLKIEQSVNVKLPGYIPDAADGVLNTSLVIADARSEHGPGKPDTDVNHQLGLARAYGKPVIIIVESGMHGYGTVNATRHVEYDETRPDALQHLRDEMKAAIAEVSGSLRRSVLSPTARSVSVLWHEALQLSPSNWSEVAAVIEICQRLTHVYSKVGRELYALRRSALLLKNARARPDLVPEALTRQKEFFEAFEQYLHVYTSLAVPIMDDWKACYSALDASLRRLAANADTDFQRTVEKARGFLKLSDDGVGYCSSSHDDLALQGGIGKRGPAWCCCVLEAMTEYADEIFMHAQATINHLLPLLGYSLDKEQGVEMHDDAAQSVSSNGHSL